MRAREISGDPAWGGATIIGDVRHDGTAVSRDDGYLYSVARTDPALVQVVEEMGLEASGECAALVVRDVPAGTRYRISEDFGLETIVIRHDIDWLIA